MHIHLSDKPKVPFFANECNQLVPENLIVIYLK